jgi:hypothetical protein
MHPLLTSFEELAASLQQGRALGRIADEFEDVLALKAMRWACRSVAMTGDAVSHHEGIGAPPSRPPPARQGGGLVAQDHAKLVGSPAKEPTLFALATGVLC